MYEYVEKEHRIRIIEMICMLVGWASDWPVCSFIEKEQKYENAKQ